jgi:outer membrane lipopolysaccharide assembly protein LptE/RlpB
MRRTLGTSGRANKLLLALLLLIAPLTSGCDFEFGEITTTSTATLNSRDVVTSLIQGWIVTPINTFIADRIDAAFDQLEGDD